MPWQQSNVKPSIAPGCPGSAWNATLSTASSVPNASFQHMSLPTAPTQRQQLLNNPCHNSAACPCGFCHMGQHSNLQPVRKQVMSPDDCMQSLQNMTAKDWNKLQAGDSPAYAVSHWGIAAELHPASVCMSPSWVQPTHCHQTACTQ